MQKKFSSLQLQRYSAQFYIYALLANALYPKGFYLGGKIGLDDLLLIFSVFFIMLSMIKTSDRNFNMVSLSPNWTYWIVFSLLIFFISASQLLIYQISVLYLFDMVKLFKFAFVIIVPQLLHNDNANFLENKIFKTIKIIVLINLLIAISQIFYPSGALNQIMAENSGQYESLNFAPFGIWGNRTHAGVTAVFFAILLFIKKEYVFFAFSFTSIIMHANKASIILLVVSLFVITLLYDSRKNMSAKKLIFLTLVAFVSMYIVSYYGESIIAGYQENDFTKVKTVMHRLNSFETVLELSKTITSSIIGLPFKGLWDEAFDSQVVLLSMRYGFLFTCYFYLLPFFAFKAKFKTNIFIFFVLISTSLTMVSSYHYRILFIAGLFIVQFTHLVNNTKCRQ